MNLEGSDIVVALFTANSLIGEFYGKPAERFKTLLSAINGNLLLAIDVTCWYLFEILLNLGIARQSFAPLQSTSIFKKYYLSI